MKITLLTGTAGDIQGWGNMETTQALATALKNNDHHVDIFFVSSYEQLTQYLNEGDFDIIWSSLYHISNNENSIHIPFNHKWVQEHLEAYNVPYIGPSAASLKIMLNKHRTHTKLNNANIPVPKHIYIESLSELKAVEGQFIVKPCYGSNSTGINESSIVNTPEALHTQVATLLEHYNQPVIIEEYLPGDEYTVLVLGNGYNRKCYSIINTIDSDNYIQYPVITSDLKYQRGLTYHKPVADLKATAEQLADQTATALGCRDHVRIDMRMDKDGQLKVIDVNGIPGMSPTLGSRSLAIQQLYHPQFDKHENYLQLVRHIVDSAIDRYDIKTKTSLQLIH